MTPKKTPSDIRRRGISPSERELEAAANRLTRRALSRHRDLFTRDRESHISNVALKSLLRVQGRTEVENVEAFLNWKINKLIIDELRRRKADSERLVYEGNKDHLLSEEMQLVRRDGVRPRGKGGLRGLTLDVISREEQEILNLAASAAVMILPDTDDQKLLSDWYFMGVSIAELARLHGNRSARATANRLARLIGSAGEPGAVNSVVHVVQELNIRTAEEFVGQIRRLHAIESMTDPLAAAIGHLEMAAMYSAAHRRQAVLGIARLRWLQRHFPSNRGLTNKVLTKLVLAACAYVVEVNDARHDRTSDLGLHDDIRVLVAVQQAVVQFAKA